MKECNNCKYKDYWEHFEPCASCTNLMGKPTHWEPQTNGDRIRQMTDEELAHFITGEDPCKLMCKNSPSFCNGDCEKRMLEWLKSPAEEGSREE